MTFKTFLLEKRVITPSQPNNNLIIVVGVPGAGKSALFQNGLLNVDNPVHVTPDKWIELMSRKEKINLKDPSKTTELYNRVNPVYLRHSNRMITREAQSNFILETLGRNIHALKNLLIRTKKRGMNIVVVMVHISLEQAKINNKTRGRSVPDSIIEDAYKSIERNFNYLVSCGEVDEAWRMDNTTRPTYQDFRSSNFIRKIK
jgi:predicted ABC-type ATPase